MNITIKKGMNHNLQNKNKKAKLFDRHIVKNLRKQ